MSAPYDNFGDKTYRSHLGQIIGTLKYRKSINNLLYSILCVHISHLLVRPRIPFNTIGGCLDVVCDGTSLVGLH
jgi:hypothetical protein